MSHPLIESPCSSLTKNQPITEENQILQVAVPTPLRQLFDYRPPSDHTDSIKIGCRVRVPFGAQTLVGFVLKLHAHSSVPENRLKPALEVIDSTPLLPENSLNLLMWASAYYHHPIGEVIEAALPSLLRKGEDPRETIEKAFEITALGAGVPIETLKKARRQQQALQHLQTFSVCTQRELEREGITSTILHQMTKKLWITPCTLRRPLQPALQERSLPVAAELCLNPEQILAHTTITQAFDQFKCFLLDGVTGSGKTAVYLKAIQSCLERGQQALMLVPEIGLTPQTIQRFQKYFSVEIAVLHSEVNEQTRATAWLKAKEGIAKIVIGTRSATWTPLKNPGLFIVDEEHDLSFKQQEGFRYSARDVLIRRAQLERCPIVLGSATPSLESHWNAMQGRYQHLCLSKRFGQAQPPTLRLLDIRHRKLQEGLSHQLLAAIQDTLNHQKQALLFINRRGFAPVLFCIECGWSQQCTHCDARLIVHLSENAVRCHHCHIQSPLPTQCPSCHAPALNPVGLGTQRIEQVLKKEFPQARIARMDRDSTQGKQSLSDLLQNIEQGHFDILIGTQMIAKGHDFQKITLVAILDLDAAFFSADYRAEERLGQLLTQVAGRAGREQGGSKVLIQTCHPENPVLLNLIQRPYSEFSKMLLEKRQAAGLPPFQHQALIRAESARPQEALSLLQRAHAKLNPFRSSVQRWGPVPSPMEKRQGRYRAQLLLEADRREPLHHALQQVVECLSGQKGRRVRWSVDVDPQEMF